ncbi:ribose-phosphate diphosphokinase [Histidinibacterium aquaticum]|uniref:ribose-phosphate diphosphokinase n=1 Tax=Histidinibacterium aquaticum TaxID=2613962 RepID=A0A5J5GAM1_9RHOB|nr:ribose-phosphate diphosphokinase [Histidinibacterium aquaticum]KAA9004980.1 ribose-phosphate pyrophosphokinase [Histidinibacterium aquaticum]
MLFFVLNGSGLLGSRIAAAGDFDCAPHEEREFAGGEHKARPLVSVRDREVVVFHELHAEEDASVNDRLVRLLFFVSTCKQNGARRVTALAPYLPYSRKDRQTKSRDPVTTRYVAALFEAAGADAVVTLDVHTKTAFQNAYRIAAIDLTTVELFAADIAGQSDSTEIAVVSPDGGGIKRAELVRKAVERRANRPVGFGLMEKRRSGGVVSGSLFAGDVQGRVVYIVDDMICGGQTIHRATDAIRARGARQVHAIAAHGLLATGAAEVLNGCGLDSVTLTDSVAPLPAAEADALGSRLRVLTVAPLIAGTLRALDAGTALSDLPPEVFVPRLVRP